METKVSGKKRIAILGRAYIVLLCLTPFLCTLIIEVTGNSMPELLRFQPMVVEVILCALIEIAAVGFIPHYSIGLILCYLTSILFGLANYYLLEFRDIPLMLMDFRVIGTAFAVLPGYNLSLEGSQAGMVILTTFLCIIAFVLNRAFRLYLGDRFRYVKSLTAALFSLAVLIVLIGFVGFSKNFGIVMNMWKPGLTYAENGSLSSFVCYAQFSSIGRPSNYSKKEVIRVLKEAEKEYDKRQKSLQSDIKPTVISIMDESFADLSVLGDVECSKKHMSFYYSLKNDPNTIWHGYNYVSTYAGGTARTEYEWLTGYSMRMFPNAQPYSQFNFTDISTSIDGFEKQGYKTVAMHPEKASNYRRNTVYEQMGFDKFLSKEDYNGYERIPFLRERTSDTGNYYRLIDEDKNTKDPLFIHNVTMENHGSFDFYLNNNYAVSVDSKYGGYGDFIRYETLLADSDRAVEKLINYYRESDEPVIICLYGDHLPKLSEDFMFKLSMEGYDKEKSEVENEERRFKVPFFIWANYDVENKVPAFMLKGEVSSSTNYLGVATRAMAGLELSPFDKYLLLLREEIPVINESGYVADERWYAANEESEYIDKLDEYERIQYAGMFDSDGIEYLFGGVKE